MCTTINVLKTMYNVTDWMLIIPKRATSISNRSSEQYNGHKNFFRGRYIYTLGILKRLPIKYNIYKQTAAWTWFLGPCLISSSLPPTFSCLWWHTKWICKHSNSFCIWKGCCVVLFVFSINKLQHFHTIQYMHLFLLCRVQWEVFY